MLSAGVTVWTRGALYERGNVAREVLVPDMTGFRDWNFNAGSNDLLGQRLRDGYDIGAPRLSTIPARFDLTRMVVGSGSKTTTEAVDYLLSRFLCVPPAQPTLRSAFLQV